MIKSKLELLKTHADVLREEDGREQMEEILGYKMTLHSDKNRDRLIEILKNKSHAKSVIQSQDPSIIKYQSVKLRNISE